MAVGGKICKLRVWEKNEEKRMGEGKGETA